MTFKTFSQDSVGYAFTTADLISAIRAARQGGVQLDVRAGQHGPRRPVNDRMVVDVGRLADVRVNHNRRIAAIGPGARWRDVMRAATPYGLAPLCGNSLDVGVAGYTLGGGVGWLSRQFGYTADNVTRLEAILADGTVVTAEADAESELFWGLRGAGANLALVTRIDVRLAPVTRVVAGELQYRWEHAADVLDAFGRQESPDHLTAMIVLSPRTDDQAPTVTVQALSTADPHAAREALDAVLPTSCRPIRTTFSPMPIARAATLGGTSPAGFELLDRITTPAILDLCADGPARLEIRHWGGAPSRPDNRNGPIGHRHVPFSITIDGPSETLARARALGTGGAFLNFLRDTARTADCYTPADYAKLRLLKAAVDPANMFGSGHNIPPATGGQNASGKPCGSRP